MINSSLNNILLIGCGKMGGALVRGWLAADANAIVIVDPAAHADRLASERVTWVESRDHIPAGFMPKAIVIAVKPQQMASVLPSYAAFRQAVFLSIAAGQTVARMTSLLGDTGHAVVRAMPNLPASIGAGISVVVAGPTVRDDQRALSEQLLAAAGEVGWVQDEALIDAVTALSGSGPAYVFALVEAMAAAGEKLGLPTDLAMRLARQTVIGSGALLAADSQDAAALRQAVTSPGGTTAAALQHLLGEGGLFDLMQNAMQAAASRARELSS